MSDERELVAAARARIGTVIRGKYRLDEILGVGGMAVVYKATHRNKAEFALKMLHPELCAKPSVRTRFLREGYAANSVKHPGAVRVVDDDVAEDGSAFLVMELLDGISVDHILEPPGSPPSVRVATAIGLQLLDVLAAAHASGIVHRDIKPANLFLTRDGTIKVLDFGIARALDDTGSGTKLTGAGMPIGTPSFMAPEQALAKSSEIDAQTDVWAVGATLFTLLTGEMVHPGEVTAQVLVAAATTPPRSIASAAPQVPAPIAEVVDRALAFDKAARWANAGEMRAALAAACAASSVEGQEKQEKEALVALFSVAVVGQHSAQPMAFAPTAESLPSLPGSPSTREPTLPAVSSSGGPGQNAGRRMRTTAVAVAATILLAGMVGSGVAVWRGRSGPSPRASVSQSLGSATATSPTGPKTQVLMIGVDNQTGDPLFEGTIDTILTRAIGLSPTLRVRSPRSLRALAAELDAGEIVGETLAQRVLARDGGTVVTVRGIVVPKGTGYALSITATDSRSGKVIFSGKKETVDGTTVVPSLGRLASDLRVALGEPPPADPRLAEQTGMSASLEADHEAIIGSALVNTGKYDEAVVYLRRVVAVDPNFGAGHWVLANVLLNMGNRAEGRREYDLAMQHLEGMTEQERDEFQSDYFDAIGAYDRAIAHLLETLRKDPGDLHLETELTDDYVRTNQTARALQMARQTAKEHPTEMIAWGNLAEVEVRASDADQALEAATKVLHEFPHPRPHAYVYLALAEALRGHGAEAAAAYRELTPRDASLASYGLADLALAEGRVAEADTLLREGIDADVASKSAGAAARKRLLLGEALLRRGDTAGAIAEARLAAQSTDLETLYGAAEVEIEAGDVKGGLSIAEALGKSPPQDARMYAKLLEAHAARRRGKASDSQARLTEAKDIADAWLVHVDAARSYLDLAQYPLAEQELRDCIARRGEGALAFGADAPSFRLLPPLTYYLARALEGQGRPEAKTTYEEFLALVRGGNGDANRTPEHDTLVADARRRLSRL